SEVAQPQPSHRSTAAALTRRRPTGEARRSMSRPTIATDDPTASAAVTSTGGNVPLTPRHAAAVGALLLGAGVALGAFGAHTLTELVTPARPETRQTPVRYQTYPGLGLMLLGAPGY